MADNFKPVQAQSFSLAGAGAIIGATSIILKSFKGIDGVNLTMADFGAEGEITLEPGNGALEESAIFTNVIQNANGTATLTGIKNVTFIDPYTETSGLLKTHAGNTEVVLSNTAHYYSKFGIKVNDETISGEWLFSLLPRSSGGNATDGNQLVTYAQALALLTGGGSINKVVVAATAGTTISTGQTVYLDSVTSQWLLTDADTPATVNNVIKGIAQGAGTVGNPVTNGVLLFGLDATQTGRTPGATQYFGNTAGALSETPGTTEVTAGQAVSATEILFFPSYNQQLTEDQQDALAGTVGTPSATNKYVTNDDTTGTGAILRASTTSNVVKFGGTGSDGALNVTSGTTTLDLTNSLYKVFNYTSINVSVGATLTFSNPSTFGTIIIIKSQGAVTIAGTINAQGFGTAGGTGGTGAGGAVAGAAGSNLSASLALFGGGTGGAAGSPGGAGGGTAVTTPLFYTLTEYKTNIKSAINLLPGAGGGGGGGGAGGGIGGNGGKGGAALYIECGGAWNFTGSINISGANGTNGTNGTAGSGGGGGGAPGTMVALYNTLTASSGTVTNTGGTGGNGSSNGGSTGGGAGGGGGFLGAGGNGASSGAGSNSTTGGGGGGGPVSGAGGTGASTSATTYVIALNVSYS